jgi:hypothetical protein
MNHRLFITIFLLAVSGCAGMGKDDNESFRADVAKNVSVGMSFVTAMEQLANAGFHCDDRSVAPAVTCTRQKDNILFHSCLQRVNFTLDATRQKVAAVNPVANACAGP